MSERSTETVVSLEVAPVIPEPLPCPFCGEAGVSLTVDSDIESVTCDGCSSTGPSLLTARDFDTEEEMYAAVVAAWNVRAYFWAPSVPEYLDSEIVTNTYEAAQRAFNAPFLNSSQAQGLLVELQRRGFILVRSVARIKTGSEARR